MKNLFLLLMLMLLSNSSFSQKIYSEDVAARADLTVYVEDVAARADLIVYKESVAARAKGNTGIWYFESVKARADKSIYFEKVAARADLKIYFTNVAARAGWKNSSKNIYCINLKVFKMSKNFFNLLLIFFSNRSLAQTSYEVTVDHRYQLSWH